MLKPLPLLAGLCLLLTTLFSSPALAQLSGTKHIPGDYATIKAAVTALNSAGVGSGGVTFDVAADYTETLSGGPIALTATGTLANPVVFQKDPATSGANPKITAYTGGTATPASTTQDGIWRLQGSDYVTISSIDLAENGLNTGNALMEYGYALYKASVSDGSKNVTIQNCTITLSRENDASNSGVTSPMTEGSAGILLMNSTAIAANTALGSNLNGSNSNNKFYGNTIQNVNIGIVLVGATIASPYTNADTGNDVGGASALTGNTIINFGGAIGATNPSAGIRTLNQYGINISYNTINNNNGSGVDHIQILRGIYNNTAPGASATISHNTVTVNGGGTTVAIAGIENAAGSTAFGNTIAITSNSIINGTYSTATSGAFYAIHNTGAPANLAISSNIIQGNTYAATSGTFFAISQNGAATTNITIDSNQIGNSTAGPVTFTAANSANQIYLYNQNGSATTALAITNNNFQGITYSTAASAAATFISNASATLSQNISNNTFTNLNINTTGNVIFMIDNVALSSTGTQNINNNSISGTFTKSGVGGTVTLFTTTQTSANGGVSNNMNNNFSNITISGATTMAGWVNQDPGSATKTISGNTFSNWTVGTNTVTALNVNLNSTANAVIANQIFGIAGGGNVTGITTGTGNAMISGNTVHTLSTTGGSTVTGIAVTSGTNNQVFGNKIYDLTLNNASAGLVNGILVSGTSLTTANVYNNLVGDLKAPNTSATTDVVRGISVTANAANSTINLYYNTIYLNATSTGTNFSTTGVYHTTSATSTTAKLDMRNNIIMNSSTPNGSGRTVAYKRSSNALANYATTSNNNLFFAGTPGANRLLYYDGVAYQTLAAYKAFVGATIDSNSISEDVVSKFLSTTGSSAQYLHIDPTKTTQVESGGQNIATYTTDFDGDVRQGNPGYAGGGTAPDIGADEIDAFKAGGLTGTYSVGTGQQFPTLTGTDGLFANINTLGLAGNTVVNITSDLAESGATALNPWVEIGGTGYTLTIQVSAATVRNITGNVAAGLIRLNGANRVTIDGSFGTPNNSYLNFVNNNTAGTAPALLFINGASNNTIKGSTFSAYTNATTGVVFFSSSTAAAGNNNNTLSANLIQQVKPGAEYGNVGIYSAGTVGKENTGNIILNNQISNFRDRGLDIPATGTTGWTIQGNSFFNGTASGATTTYTAGFTVYGIRIIGGSGYTISGNYIGGSAALAGGSAAAYSISAGALQFDGIFLSPTSATPASVIKGNTITNINVSCAPNNATIVLPVFYGIETAGSGITVGGSLANEGNMIGSNNSNNTITITTTTTTATFKSAVRGISSASTGGSIVGNKIGGIDIINVGTAPGPTQFTGVYVNNATAQTPISGNTIGSTTVANSVRVTTGSTAVGTTLTGVGIGGSVTSTVLVDGNTISNMGFLFTGGTATGVTGVNNGGTTGSVVTISNNLISKNTTNATAGSMIGVSSLAAGSTSVTINNNTIDLNTSTSTSTFFYGINVTGTNTPTIAINSNTFSNNAAGALATGGLFAGINTNATATTLSINGNTFTGNTFTPNGGAFNAIVNSGAITGSITINANNIGNASAGPVIFNSASSVTQNYIRNSAGGAAATLTITGNNFQNINYATPHTGQNVLIINSAATLSQIITGNTFTNLNVSSTGSFTFISDNVAVGSGGTQTVNNNSIVGTFTKSTGGTITLFTNTTPSTSGATFINNNNNFSGITVTAATTVAGWVVTDSGPGTHNIQNNTFSNWTGGTAAITALAVNLTGTSSVSSNTITGFTNGASIVGIATNGNEAVSQNDIHTFSSSASSVSGISVVSGAGSISRNKIYDLSTTATAGTVNGILIPLASTVTSTLIYNNLIGDLKAPNGNSGTDIVRGINILNTNTSAINVYYNTIYIGGTSSGTNFSTTGVFQTAGAAGIAMLDLRNNIIVNYTTPKGSGRAVALRRSGANTNYASTSNNNLYYAGTPSTTHLLYYDATNLDQTLVNLRTHTGADALSVTEDITPALLSTTGSSSVFLHINSAVTTAIESGAVNISGITDDFDGQVRAGNPGFVGASTDPDIGADEIFGIETTPPTITYTLLPNTGSTSNVTLSSVTITDASGVNVLAGTKPRIYYKRSTDNNALGDNTSSTNGWKYTEATNGASPFSFTIDYSLLYGGAVGIAGSIQYFVIAQDVATTANVAINSGTFANTPASVALTSAAFPLTGTINSYLITFSGTYNVGATEVFTSLTRSNGLFAAINSSGLGGSIVVKITSNLSEDGTVALNQWTESGPGNYTLTIQPDAATFRTISGDASGGLIRLDNADRVTIDGRSGGSGSYLKFSNTNVSIAGGTALTLVDGATNNTIRNADFQAAADITHGVILFGLAGTTGNSNNTIDNVTINAYNGTQVGVAGIVSNGTLGTENQSNTVSNSAIHGFNNRGLDINAGSSAWTITANSFYNGDLPALSNYTTGSAIYGIKIATGSGYTVTNNYIGGSQVQATGSAAAYSSSTGDVSFWGIQVTTSSATPASAIKGNTIKAVSVSTIPTTNNSTAFVGIETGGSGIDIGGSTAGEGNTIGSTSGNSAIVITTTNTTAFSSAITGINCASSGGSVIGNLIGGIDVTNTGSAPSNSTIRGIRINSVTAPANVTNNVIGSTTATNSIRVMSTSVSTSLALQGFSIGNLVASPINIANNTIQNLSNLSTTSSGTFAGINNAGIAASSVTITGNTIRDISAASNASANSGAYNGIFSQGPSTISNNTITNITVSASGTAVQLRGIAVSGAVAHSITGNTISGLSTASTKTANIETNDPSGYALVGILNSATVTGQVISGNTIFSLTASTAATANVAVLGVGANGASGSGNIFQNRIHGLLNSATGTGSLPGISGITAFNGTYNVYNNAIKVDNSPNTNGVKVYGIVHASSTAWNYFYNTVVVAGSTATTARSAAFIRTVSGTILLRDNIFQNTRTSPGSIFAISNTQGATNWSATASDYNDYYSTGSVGEWSGAANTLAQWRTSSGGDANSFNQQVTFIASTHDLEPTNTANCLINGTATQITSPISITVDINNITRGTPPDMGAYEFTYVNVSITASNDGPVCDASLVDLSVDPGSLTSPTFSWADPSNAVVSTDQNPSVAATAGIYTVTVTDANGCPSIATTTVATLARPTAVISGTADVCDGSSSDLVLDVTGTGNLSGVLSTGDVFSGVTPQVLASVSPASTTIYTITSLSDDNCASLPQDLTGSATITVTPGGDWLGTDDADWNNANNWCGGVPTSTLDVHIVSGTPFSPEISTPGALAQALMIDAGAALSLTSTGTLDLKGSLDNEGDFNISAGTTVSFSGTDTQNINGNMMNFYNIEVTNTGVPGVQVESSQNLLGALTLGTDVTFDADGSGDASVFTLKSFADRPTEDASIAALPSGSTVTGVITVERFMSIPVAPRDKIYRYIGSPVQNATVADIQNEIPITGAFTGSSTCPGCSGNSMFYYDETAITDVNNSGIADYNDGYVSYPTSSNSEVLTPGVGYTMYVRGQLLSTALWNVSGNVTQGDVSIPVSYSSSGDILNDGWNLVSNPYPSAIDWEASGWSKTNIDGTIYITDNTQPAQQYATWNGVVGTNGGTGVIATAQGFWVKANDVSPALTVSETVKTSASTTFFREMSPEDLLRITLTQGAVRDEAVIHFREDATSGFDSNADAIKLANSTFNLSTIANNQNLAINSLTMEGCSGNVKLNVANVTAGTYKLSFSELESFENAMSITLVDKFTSTNVDVLTTSTYDFSVTTDPKSFGNDRFAISFVSKKYDATATNGFVCTEGTVQLTASGAPADGRYNWYASLDSQVALTGNGNMFTTPVLNTSTDYFVAATDRWGCEGARVIVTADVKTPAAATISQASGTLTSNYNEGNQWLFNDQVIEGQTGSSFTPTKSGTYKVQVATDGCEVTSAAFDFALPPPIDTVTGLGDEPEFSVKFVPNPVSDKLTVIITRADLVNTLRIANQLGQLVGTIPVKRSGTGATVEYSMKDLPAGVYIMQVVGEGFIHTERVVKL